MYILFLHAYASLAGSTMFSSSPFVRLSVRSFICPLPTFEGYRPILKTNKPISMQIRTNLPDGQSMRWSISGWVSQSHRRLKSLTFVLNWHRFVYF